MPEASDPDLSQPPAPGGEDGRVEVRSYFVRHRNALLARASLSPLYLDYYLHLMQHGIKVEPGHDATLKDALAALTLHLASRPWKEATAWTVNFQDPLVNIFVAGDSFGGRVAGRVYSGDVKKGESNVFWSQVVESGREPRKSAVEFQGGNFFRSVEEYYLQSEQRPARYFHYAEEDIVMVSAQPDCDMDWFGALDDDAIRAIDQSEEMSLLERRYYRFDCGCDLDRILGVIAPMARRGVDELFGNDPLIRITCPRCGAGFEISRERVESFLAIEP